MVFFKSEMQDGKHRLGPMQSIEVPMKQFGEDETVDYCIVGVGSAGGVVAAPGARGFQGRGP